jgi:hypothetical protein
MSFQSKFVQMLIAEVDDVLLKAATPDGGVQEEFATAEEARDTFRKVVREMLLERLTGVAVPVAAPPAESPKEKKKRGPMSEEKKAAMKAKRDATLAAKKAGSAEPSPAVAPAADAAPAAAAVVAEAPAPAAESPKEKKKRAPMTDEAKAAMKAKREATLAAKAGNANLPKIDPTWRKHLKAAAKAGKQEVTKEMETALLTHLNSLSKEDFNAKKAEEHVVAFLAAPTGTNAAGGGGASAAAAATETELDVVEFEGQDYYVNPKTKRVYVGEGEQDPETGAWTSWKAVGYVGMAAFAEMTLE